MKVIEVKVRLVLKCSIHTVSPPGLWLSKNPASPSVNRRKEDGPKHRHGACDTFRSLVVLKNIERKLRLCA